MRGFISILVSKNLRFMNGFVSSFFRLFAVLLKLIAVYKDTLNLKLFIIKIENLRQVAILKLADKCAEEK